MGSKVWSVMDVLGLDRIQAFADKLTSKTEWDTKQLSLGALRNKPGDAYLDQVGPGGIPVAVRPDPHAHDPGDVLDVLQRSGMPQVRPSCHAVGRHGHLLPAP